MGSGTRRRAHDRVRRLITAADEPDDLTEARISEYNRIILDGLDLEPDVVPGEYTTKQHGVPGYRAPSPDRIRDLMPKFVAWLNTDDNWSLPDGMPPMVGTVLKAICAHLYLAWIHPFGDGNGRTARMVEAEILARGAVPDVSYHLFADHYNKTRTAYYGQLAATSAVPQGDPNTFIAYAVQGFLDGLQEQIDMVKVQHGLVVWTDYIGEALEHGSGKVVARQRLLLMDLAVLYPRAFRKDELRGLSARVAEAYGGLTTRAVSRDVNALVGRRLIVKTLDGRFAANLAMLSAFVPARRDDD